MAFSLALPFLLFAPAVSRWTTATKLLVIVLALLVAYARIAMGVHYLSDVLGGMAMAVTMMPPAVLLANWLSRVRGFKEDHLPALNRRWSVALGVLTILFWLLA